MKCGYLLICIENSKYLTYNFAELLQADENKIFSCYDYFSSALDMKT